MAITNLEPISIIGFWFKIAAGPSLKPQATLVVVEDLKRGTNKDIEPKDIFEMGSSFSAGVFTKFYFPENRRI